MLWFVFRFLSLVGNAGGSFAKVLDSSSPTLLFQFGDSLSDTGNALILYPDGYEPYGRPPYGQTFFQRSTGRISDGRLVVDYLASGLGLPFLEPYKQAASNIAKYHHGTVFSTAGATALDLEFLSKHNVSLLPQTKSLSTQLQWFLQFKMSAPRDIQATFSKGLYIVGEIGGDDYEYMYNNGWSYPQMHEFAPLVVQAIANHIRELYKNGARMFLVPNIPLQGCSAGHLAAASDSVFEKDRFGCILEFNHLNHVHNSLLEDQIDILRNELSGAAIHYADYAGAYIAVLKNPRVYGISDPFVACCGTYTSSHDTSVYCGETKTVNGITMTGNPCNNPSEFIYWNDGHFTDYFNGIVANAFLTSDDYVRPPIRNWVRKKGDDVISSWTHENADAVQA